MAIKRISAGLLLAVMLAAPHSVLAHDTFLKRDSLVVAPDSSVTLQLLNGTFETSDNSIALERMQDVRIVTPEGAVVVPDKSEWRLTDTLNELTLRTGGSGTYAVGVSIRPRTFDLDAEAFNDYLAHDGVLDALAERRAAGELDQDVTETYSKHVKALLQVGDPVSAQVTEPFGYPIEIVPQRNPYTLVVGDTLPVRILLHGAPVADQLVYASYSGHHAHDDEAGEGGHSEAVQSRTDADGIAEIPLGTRGLWYVRLIHMARSEAPDVDYVSNWATLTFEVR